MGDRFENEAAEDYTRIVRDYPLSDRADEAKDRLQEMKRPVPAADPAAVARMKYENENRTKNSMLHNGMSVFASRPDTHLAAKTGAPMMKTMRPPTPVSVPRLDTTAAPNGTVTGGASGATSSDVSATVNTNTSAVDARPDARQSAAGAAAPPTASAVPGAAGKGMNSEPAAGVAAQESTQQPQAPLPTNRQLPKAKKKTKKQIKQEQEQMEKMKQQQAAPASTPAAPAATTPPQPQ